MTFRRVRFVVAVSFMTATTLAGSIALPFFILNILDDELGVLENPHYDAFVLLTFALSMILVSLFTGGAAWGWGISLLTNTKPRTLVKTGAITWAISVFVAGFILYFSQLLGAEVDRRTSLDVHTIFTILFLPVIGLTVASVSFRMTGKIGLFDVQNATARKAGLAAMVGFLIMSVVLLHFFRWEVGGPFAGRRYSMISIMNLCNAGAALLGGATMAWIWVGSGRTPHFLDTPKKLDAIVAEKQ